MLGSLGAMISILKRIVYHHHQFWFPFNLKGQLSQVKTFFSMKIKEMFKGSLGSYLVQFHVKMSVFKLFTEPGILNIAV